MINDKMQMKIFAAVISVLFFAALLYADESAHYFEQGNKFYKEGAYDKAIEQYQKVLALGYESGEVYFNLGNAYYRTDQIGLARLYYEKAARFLKNDEALQQNLGLVQMRLVDQIETPPRLFLAEWWDAFLNLFPISTLSWITVGLLWLFLTALAIRIYFASRGRGRRLRGITVTLLTALLLSALILVQKIYRFESEQYGIILQPTVTVHASPSDSGTEVFVLHEGTKVEVLRRTGDWLEIRLADGKTGWLQNKMMEVI
ncbi:MAG TPA: tetratricopeptide repeat protein [Caldithrix abyssi]|uniref:Tetratricopeptide repeat protein n=1 Tax=Caldithrix abyssi TaxID=187145 RepID=A0A7V4U1N6_CALAY|nr:tetratricopeptide repeat protein [Caldithrix abyssi]